MIKHLILLLFIGFAFLSCASTNDDAIRQQEDFIKNHPTWKGHDFKFEKRKPELNAVEIGTLLTCSYALCYLYLYGICI